MDTRLRLLLVLGGLPTPEVQHELLGEYGFVVARFDLAYAGARLAIEYDGTVHGSRVFSADDRWRDATTSGHGWQTLRFVRDDVVLSRRRTVTAVRQALAHRPSPAGEWPTR
jgi:very-short-patch-repair endonuclease